MQTLPSQFVFPHPPAELLLFLVAILVVWAVVRVIMDARTWFKEEVLNDNRSTTKDPAKPRPRKLLSFLVVILVTWAVVTVVRAWLS